MSGFGWDERAAERVTAVVGLVTVVSAGDLVDVGPAGVEAAGGAAEAAGGATEAPGTSSRASGGFGNAQS
jgi:hypothetical protein